MNALVKKEIRLLLPSWAVAMVLALPPACTRSDDGIPVFLLFFGMAIMALTSIGRETSLNTFSQLLAQPAERLRIWKIKLTVLAVAFLAVFVLWRLAVTFSFKDYGGSVADPEASEAVVVAGYLVVAATFSGGLWAALLLRQIAGAFWLALLVPATLAGFTTGFVSVSQPGSAVIGSLCVIIGLYFFGGFLLARRLFFRAQDVGWTGGIIALPQFKLFGAPSKTVEEIRQHRPLVALIKKEFQLHQLSLMAAGGLLMLHIGIVILRAEHTFPRNSAGEILTTVFWMLWLILPVIIGAMSIAEERRLGVMEGQLCLPASRRLQFFIKGSLALFLGILLGGVIPCVLEWIGINHSAVRGMSGPGSLLVIILGLAIWLSLVSLFASSLAKNFLQAVGFAIATFIVSSLAIPALAGGRMIFFESYPAHSILSLFIATPTLVVTLIWLAYLNYKNFRDGWYLLRRSLLIFGGAIFFVVFTTAAIYNRGWEFFKPAEPPHGVAKLSLSNPPSFHLVGSRNIFVRLPDGRIWFDYIDGSFYGYDYGNGFTWRLVTRMLLNPLPESYGPQRFIAGSNWVTATTGRVNFGGSPDSKGYLDTVGIKTDGTLWVSDRSERDKWTSDTLRQFGGETNWSQLLQSGDGVVLLKNDGTLWRWGTISNAWQSDWSSSWPGLPAFKPYQIGTDSDWQDLFRWQSVHLRKTDGTIWSLEGNWRSDRDEFRRETNFDLFITKTGAGADQAQPAFVQTNGTLWVLNRYWDGTQMRGTGMSQVGHDNDWQAVSVAWGMMVALKTDGSLWQWHDPSESVIKMIQTAPKRLGIHSDWVAITSTWDSVLALAGDGSLWLWPDKENHDPTMLLQYPKQPQFLGNVFNQAGQ